MAFNSWECGRVIYRVHILNLIRRCVVKLKKNLSRLVLVTITVTLITKNYNVSHQARNPKP